MEQELNDYKELESDLFHIRLQYKNQNLSGNLEFKNWKENAIQYIEKKQKNNILYNFIN